MDAPLSDAERAERRSALVVRFAVLTPTGAAFRHDPSDPTGNAGKVILASQAYARRFAAALAALGEQVQEAYYCAEGHWHVRNAARQHESLVALRARRSA